ncbi:MAG: hypothetical protein OXT64_03965 [Gammaproteobacteria bacterium]|nr:hypothetical protein [Gammaproteobacteria bacterium]
MFGTLSAEPSSHDIDQLTFARGGAKAVGFNRSGGFSMDSTAKSGSDTFHAGIEYAMEPRGLVADRRGVPGSFTRQDTDRQRIVLNAAGPILPSRLFFYASYFEPREDRTNNDTAYGPVKDYVNERRELLRPADLRAHGYGIAERWLPHIEPRRERCLGGAARRGLDLSGRGSGANRGELRRRLAASTSQPWSR